MQIITTFASRVEASINKAQATIDGLLALNNLPLTPKDPSSSPTPSSPTSSSPAQDATKIKNVMDVIKRASVLQKDVDRLGQALGYTRPPSAAPQQRHNSPGKEDGGDGTVSAGMLSFYRVLTYN